MPATAVLVAVASHSAPRTCQGMTSLLGLSPLIVQACTTGPLISSAGCPNVTRFGVGLSASAIGALMTPIPAAAAVVANTVVIFTWCTPCVVGRWLPAVTGQVLTLSRVGGTVRQQIRVRGRRCRAPGHGRVRRRSRRRWPSAGRPRPRPGRRRCVRAIPRCGRCGAALGRSAGR